MQTNPNKSELKSNITYVLIDLRNRKDNAQNTN